MEQWYYVEGEREIGPVSGEEFQTMVDSGRVSGHTLVWKEGMESWQPFEALSAPGRPTLDGVICGECGNRFPEGEVIRYRDSWICASCKPLFFQRMKEGLLLPGAMDFAGFWTRCWAKMIDSFLVGIVQFVLIMAMGVLLAIIGPRGQNAALFFGVMMFLLQMGVIMAYSVFFVGKYSATPGKMALGIKIVTGEGGAMTYGLATKRFFGEMLSGFTMYIGYIIAAFDEEKRTLHDRLCDTRVIRK